MKFPNVDLSMYIRSLATTESNGKSVLIWPIMYANASMRKGRKRRQPVKGS